VPGVVSEITNKLAEKGISITNIRILEAREDIYGVLRISFRSENDRDLAMNLLKKETPHEVYIQ
ncbi:ACT domain-containing protein, partial [[Eubacterium] rectale]